MVDVDRGTLVGEGLPLVPIDPRHLTLAFYYPWFDGSSFSHGLWMDRPTGPYDTTDPAQVSAMVQQAAERCSRMR